MNERLAFPFLALRIGLGAAAFLAGLDKFFNILANWESYLSPLISGLIPVTPSTFMRVAGVIEMIAGAAILAGLTRLGGYVVAAWLVAIAASLVTTGQFIDVAVRDVIMAIAAFTMARMSEVRETSSERVETPLAQRTVRA